MNKSIKIEEVKGDSGKIKDFEKTEWSIADIEHYGGPRNFKKKKYKFVANNENGDIFGVLDLIIEANVSYLEGLIISHNHRGEGIGKKLLLFAEKFAKNNKCTKIWTETDEDWQAANFYKKMGFEICGTHENHYLGRRGLILTKYL